MDNKKCCMCGETKSVSEFYKRNDRCKSYRSFCIKCDNERTRKYSCGRTEYNRKYSQENRHKDKAQKIAQEKYSEAQPCSLCGKEKAHRHHEDYTKPLDIVWLCHSCHMKAHVPAPL